jgi:hypothetical protein
VLRRFDRAHRVILAAWTECVRSNGP